MSSKDPERVEWMRCPCCGLRQHKALDATGITAAVCAKCTHHQGDEEPKRLKRAEFHEKLLREALATCIKSEARATEAAAEARRQTAAALRSRDQLAARIQDAADSDDRQALQWLARSRDVIQWADRVRQDAGRYDALS
jgi:hypothetical protein